MIFTSYTYVVFLAVAFALVWTIPERYRNGVLVALSYLFYGSWRWPYVILLLAVSAFTFYFGRLVARQRDPGRLLMVGITVELLPLLYYKYAGFALANVASAGSLVGLEWHPSILATFIPLGISFFTFQGIAYLVDVATGEPPFSALSDFLLFKAFWPQLIAGPIIRPGEIREQITTPRSIDYPEAALAIRRILMGFFKKVVIADTLAPIVDAVFLPGARPAFIDAAIGTVAFGLQIYFDFSAYSDIAIGSARLMGFRFPENFESPYLARSPQEFWNRWHMTLTRWIRDYVYTPLSFATRRRPRLAVVWLLLAMALCGLWHGARWTFVAWGVWHGVLLVLNHTLLRPVFVERRSAGLGSLVARALSSALTLWAVMLGWVFFRAETMTQAADLFRALFSLRGGLRPAIIRENAVLVVATVFVGTVLVQFAARQWSRVLAPLEADGRYAVAVRSAVYALLVVTIIVFDREAKAFVYFQF